MVGISVAMCAYNGAKYIAEQLQSIAKQSYRPIEVIITDDGSTDNTENIVHIFAASAPFPVKFIKNEKNLGYRANFMKAASLCRGDWIAFCDQDDVWMPNKLQTMEKCIAEGVLLIYHNAFMVNEKMNILGDMKRIAPRSHINPPLTIEPWRHGLGYTYLFHRSLLQYSSLREGSFSFSEKGKEESHDQWIYFLASCLGTIVYIPDKLVLYRQHADNVVGWKSTCIWWDMVCRLLAGDAEDISMHAATAFYRAKTLEIMEMGAYRRHRYLIEAASAAYMRLSDYYKKRLSIYSGRNPVRKIYMVMVLIFIGAYGRKMAGGTGLLGLPRDLLRSLVPLIE